MDPIMQALMALCSHSEYVATCAPCEMRRASLCEHLADMARCALGLREV